MDIKKKLMEKKPGVDAAIEKYVPRKLDKAKAAFLMGKPRYAYDLDAAQKSVNDVIWDLLDRGGKRWRPALMLWTAEAIAGKNAAEKLSDFAVIPEVVHNGTLVADDVEDDSLQRRGKPCLHKIYGVDVAVNAGNAMYFIPLLVLAKKKGVPDRLRAKAYEIIVQEMVNLSYGQGFDIWWHKGNGEPTEAQYLQMCAYKTGTLARMSAKLGAVLANASQKQVEAVGDFAESLGVAFQIQDDILNIISAQETYGKDVGEDITEGKRSLLVIHALKNLRADEKAELTEILNAHTRDQERIMRAIRLIEKSGSIAYAKKAAKEMVRKAWKRLEPMLRKGEAKEALHGLALYAIERKA